MIRSANESVVALISLGPGRVIPRWLKEQEGPPAWANTERVANLLGAVALAVTDRLQGVLCAASGCSIQGVAALQWIERFPGIRPGDLARVLDIGGPAVSGLVSRLRKEGLILVTRARRDQREMALRLSELGERHVRLTSQARTRSLESLIELLPVVLWPRLVKVCERLLAMLPESPRHALATCRHCNWSVCRTDPEVPCPVVLTTLRRGGSTSRSGEGPELMPRYEDRRTIEGGEPPIQLWLEPSNVAFELGRGRLVEVLCHGPWPGRVEVELSPDGHVALYAWERATFTVLEADREIFVEERPLGLRTPRGTSMRTRVESLFGPFEARRARTPRRWL